MKSFLILACFALFTFAYSDSPPGQCPDTRGRNDTICDVLECDNDADCNNGEMCCANDCGSPLCVQPVICEYCPPAEINNCTYGQSEETVNGCRTCKCKENPCKNKNCESGKCIILFGNENKGAYGKCVPIDLPKECYEEVETALKMSPPTYYYDVVREGCFKRNHNSYNKLIEFKSFEDCAEKCNLNCRRLKCQHCKHGYQTEYNGCPSCSCKPKPHRECERQLCKMDCVAGYERDRYGCQTCKCKSEEAPRICYKPKVVGVCEASIVRYFYNPVFNKCERFLFGGCGGNENNFNNYEECQRKCTNPGCPVPSCASSCKHGYNYTPDGCQTCSCAVRNVCEGIMCAENYVCVGLQDCSHNGCTNSFQCQPEGSVSPLRPHCGTSNTSLMICIVVGVLIVVIMVTVTAVLCVKMKLYKKLQSKIKPQLKNLEKPPIQDIPQNIIIQATYPEEKKVPLA